MPDQRFAMVDAIAVKIGMIFVYFAVSLGGACGTIYAPPWLLEGATLPVLCALAAGIMVGVALAHLLPESDDLLSDKAVPGYRMAFALVGMGIAGVLCIEHVTMAIISKKQKKKKHGSQSIVQGHRHSTNARRESFRTLSACLVTHNCDHSHDHNHHAGHNHEYTAPPHDHADLGHGHDADMHKSLLGCGDASHCSHSSAGIELNDDHGHAHHHHYDNDHAYEVSRQSRTSVSSHNHGFEVLGDIAKATSLRDLVALYALELSVTVHSIILGLDYGLETDSRTLVALTIALTFHQTIEGIAMGAAIVNFKDAMAESKIITFMVFFASTISLGVIIGIISSYQGQSSASDTLQGIFSALAAGSLLYVAMTEQVGTYFDQEDLQDQLGTKLMMIAAFSGGFGAMAALACWE